MYLVRHAIAEDRESWSDEDDRRPLTPEGRSQAARLVGLLGAEPIEAVYSSPALRCRQTVEPLALHLGEPVREVEALREGGHPDDVLEFLLSAAKRTVVGCTHGDIVLGLVELLDAQGLLQDERKKYKKGSTWMLKATEGEIRRARYLPPP
jgi:8-oxo-(d)GTP phosphatase